jgi:hypothetical protein
MSVLGCGALMLAELVPGRNRLRTVTTRPGQVSLLPWVADEAERDTPG